MNAVWLNDELMVVPSLVGGFQIVPSGDDLGYTHTETLHIYVLIAGARHHVWSVSSAFPTARGVPEYQADLAAAQASNKIAAEAEMARLSALLWPASAVRQCRHPFWRQEDGVTIECILDLGHFGAHRFQ